MPLYMDLHNVVGGVTAKDVALAHLQDLEIQWKHKVKYLRYWLEPEKGTIFCLVEAPSADAAMAVHRESHGLVAERIIEVEGGSMEQLLGTVEEAPAWTPESSEPPPAESAFRTIFFTDMEGSTALTELLGDSKAMDILREHDTVVREALKGHGGNEVKHTGDGIMASFVSVARAVECAVRVQTVFAARNEQNRETPIQVRIGLSAGEPIEENRDLFGAAVQLTARLCARAEPGCILVSNVVRELCIGRKFIFTDRGEVRAKGFKEPVRAFEVGWRE
jgi:class 3 adenylate cyclase